MYKFFCLRVEFYDQIQYIKKIMFKLKSYPAQAVRQVGIYGEVTREGKYYLFTIAQEELFIKFWFIQVIEIQSLLLRVLDTAVEQIRKISLVYTFFPLLKIINTFRKLIVLQSFHR